MKKMLNERYRMHNLYSVFVRTFVITVYYGSGTVINYGSGLDFLTSYGYGSGSTTLVFTPVCSATIIVKGELN
jgi:hypothetical protein